jgi:nuclear-control-of-ATPase protein 2
VNKQGSEKDKVKFMVLERGPIAFLYGLKKIARSFLLESSLTSGLVSAAYTRINERVTMLNTLRKRLAVIIGQVSSMIFIVCIAEMGLW